MEKDLNFTFPGKDGSLTSNVPQAFLQKQQSTSCISLDSSYNDAMASGCQRDARKAVADSKKTKAVIASRRNDFFSDLMMPLISTSSSCVTLSTTSFPVTGVSIPSAYVSNYSTHANDPLTVTSIPVVSLSIPGVSLSIPSTTVNILSTDKNVPLTSSNVNIPSTTSNVPLATVNQPSTTVNVPSTTVNVSSATRVNIPSAAGDISLSSISVPSTTVNVPSSTVNVPSAAVNVASVTVASTVSSTTVTSNVSSRNATIPSLTSMGFPVVSPGIPLSGSNSSHLIDHSLESSLSTTSLALSLNAASSRTVPTSNFSKTTASTIPSSSASTETCQVPDNSVKPNDAIPYTSSSKLGAEKLASGLSFEAFKLGSEQPDSVQANYAVVSYTVSKIGFEKPNRGNTDETVFSLESSNLNSGKPDGVKTSINVPHITGWNQGQHAYPPVECIQAPVQVVEPVCLEATPCSSIHLEPSPERIWGPQVSFLTFSCLDISRTEVVGQMRQVSSTGCLEVLGSGHRQDDSSEATKLIPSNDGMPAFVVCSYYLL